LVFLVAIDSVTNLPNFERPFFATVGGNPKKKEKNQIGLRLRELRELRDLDWSSKYLMFESSAYFLAVEPVLEAMKKLDPLDLPFHQTILNGTCPRDAPNYIQSHRGLNYSAVYTNWEAVMPQGNVWRSHGIKLPGNGAYNPDSMREPLETTLDRSQLDALEHILNHKVALIQGPPGSGKTFIGVKVLINYNTNNTALINTGSM